MKMAINVAITIAYVLLQRCFAQEAKVSPVPTTLSPIISSATVDTSFISAAVGMRPVLPLGTTTTTPTLSATTLASASVIPNSLTISREIFQSVTPHSSSQIITGSPFTVDTDKTSTLFTEPSLLPSVPAPFESTTASRNLPILSPLDILPLAPFLLTRNSASTSSPKAVHQQSLTPSGSRVPQASPSPPKVVEATFQISSTSSEPPTADIGAVSVPSMAASRTVPASIVLTSGLSPSTTTDLASTMPSSSLLVASPSSSQVFEIATTTSLPTKSVPTSPGLTESSPAPQSLFEATSNPPGFADSDLIHSASDSSSTKPVEFVSTTTFPSLTKSGCILTSRDSTFSTIGVTMSPVESGSENQLLLAAENPSTETELITSSATSTTLTPDAQLEVSPLPTAITTLAAFPRETSATVTFFTTPASPMTPTSIISDTSTLLLGTTESIPFPSTNRAEITNHPSTLSSSSLPSIITKLLTPGILENLSVTTTDKPRKLRKYPKFRFKVNRFRTTTKKSVSDTGKMLPKAPTTPLDSTTPPVRTHSEPLESTSTSLPTATGLPPNDNVAVISSNGSIEPIPGMPLDGGNFFNYLTKSLVEHIK